MLKQIKQAIRTARLRRQQLQDLNATTCLPGGERGGWPVLPELLHRDAVVYSFGVGDNIAWDLGMIEQFGVTVHAFDPTPESVAWFEAQDTPPALQFHACGLSHRDGLLEFYPPKKPGRMHYSQDRQKFTRSSHQKVSCPVRRLATIAAELGHTRIDVLKLDIEGSEFDAIPELLGAGLPIGQLLVEIHYNHPTRSFQEGMQLIQRIKQAGMQCFFVSPRGYEFGFVHPAWNVSPTCDSAAFQAQDAA
ncbi:MAG: FkbM family methyltransferase [Planctomycetales bacterium]|nr:FkbM family methyltransferase [Planctomycetales bacterium]